MFSTAEHRGNATGARTLHGRRIEMAGKSRRVASRQGELSRRRKRSQRGPGTPPAAPARPQPQQKRRCCDGRFRECREHGCGHGNASSGFGLTAGGSTCGSGTLGGSGCATGTRAGTVARGTASGVQLRRRGTAPNRRTVDGRGGRSDRHRHHPVSKQPAGQNAPTPG